MNQTERYQLGLAGGTVLIALAILVLIHNPYVRAEMLVIAAAVWLAGASVGLYSLGQLQELEQEAGA